MSTFMQALDDPGQIPTGGSQANSNSQMVENVTDNENSGTQHQNDAAIEGIQEQQIPSNN